MATPQRRVLELEDEEVRALGVLAELASQVPRLLQTVAVDSGVSPEAMMGLIMKMESLLDPPEEDGKLPSGGG